MESQTRAQQAASSKHRAHTHTPAVGDNVLAFEHGARQHLADTATLPSLQRLLHLAVQQRGELLVASPRLLLRHC
jgi:hypothetical protein